MLKLLAEMNHTLFCQVLPSWDKWCWFSDPASPMLMIQEQGHKTLQWFTDRSQLNLDIFKEGKTETSVCTILHQREKGDWEENMGYCSRCHKKNHPSVSLFGTLSYDASLVSQ